MILVITKEIKNMIKEGKKLFINNPDIQIPIGDVRIGARCSHCGKLWQFSFDETDLVIEESREEPS